LLNRKEGLAAFEHLLLDTADAPYRYQWLATLMKVDLETWKDDSLDHIARRMDDVYRRLDLGRAGKKVVEVEDSIIASLDKIIEEMEEEEKKKKGGGGGGGGSGSQQSNSPMPDSRLAGANGAGETDRKPLGAGAGWGELPPKKREEALQQIGKDFPAHYREAIEQYFRKLASEE